MLKSLELFLVSVILGYAVMEAKIAACNKNQSARNGWIVAALMAVSAIIWIIF